MEKVFNFIMLLLVGVVVHLFGHALVFNSANIYCLQSFNTLSWVVFILYYALVITGAFWSTED